MITSDPVTPGLAAEVAEVLARHRFHRATSAPEFGWCEGRDSWKAKPIGEHEAHVAAEVTKRLAEMLARPEVEDAVADAIYRARQARGGVHETVPEQLDARAALAAVTEALGAGEVDRG